MKPPAKNPCGSCPYRKDVPAGVWSAEEYEKLPLFDLPTHEQPMSLFSCHQNNGHLCSGWVGTHDMENTMGIRLGFAFGWLSEEDAEAIYDYACPVPLFESGQAAAEWGLSGIENPDEKTTKIIKQMLKKGKTR